MNKLFATTGLMALPLFCKTWKNVSIVDVDCSAKVRPIRIWHFERGRRLSVLHATDHLHVTVTGDHDGDIIKVESLKI